MIFPISLIAVLFARQWVHADDFEDSALDGDMYSDNEYGGYDPYSDMDGYVDYSYGGYGRDPYDEYDYGYDYGYGYGGGSDDPEPIPMEEITTLEELAMFLEESDQEPAVIGFFDLSTHGADKEMFDETQKAMETKFRFAFTSNVELLKQMKYEGCAVVVYKPSKFVSDTYEMAKTRFPSKAIKSSGTLEKFINEKVLPLVGLKTDMYDDVATPELTLFVDVDVEKNFMQFQLYADRLRKVATDYQGKVLFNIADKTEFNYEMEAYGLDLTDRKDTGVGLRSGAYFYKMETPFSMDNVREFVEDFLAGRLVGNDIDLDEPDYNLSPAEEEDMKPTTIVYVDNENFNDVVLATDNDVMVEFYAPWCGYCKALEPELHQLAEEFAYVDTVTIAAMDASTHTAPAQFDVEGFPTLYFIPGDKSKTPIPYEGPRKFKAMSNFIRKHVTNKL